MKDLILATLNVLIEMNNQFEKDIHISKILLKGLL